MVTDNDRFRLLFKSLKVSQVELARQLNISKANINGWINDRTQISGESQKRILKAFPNINARWFLFGEKEENYEDDSKVELIKNNNTIFKPSEISKLISELINQLRQKDNQIKFLQTELQKKWPEENEVKRL